MKRFVLVYILALAFAQGGCAAISDLEDAADALNDAEKALDKLHTAECMSSCDEGAKACFDNANTVCIDGCEVIHNTCENAEDECLDIANDACSVYEDNQYYDCMDAARDACDGDCDQQFSDCGQNCGDLLRDCFFESEELLEEDPAFSGCVSACIQTFEDTLKDIDL